MKITDSKKSNDGAGVFLRFLYNTVPGRFVLRGLCSPSLSRAAGAFLDTPLSRPLISPFLKKGNIDLSLYEKEDYRCFNDCFTRKIKAENRPFSAKNEDFCAPCDGYLSACRIKDGAVYPVKQSMFTLESLLGGDVLRERFRDGILLTFRLCVEHYHRYAFFDGGHVLSHKKIEGRLHTVRPIALEKYPVFCENSRECTFLKTDNFGTACYVEVGAMLVGKIANRQVEAFRRGEEKGMFLYGGSTVILLLEKDSACIREGFFDGMEHPVIMGQVLN